MSEENTKSNKKCDKKSKLMFVYGILQLSSSVISAVALAAIALSICPIKEESKIFNKCVDEVINEGQDYSSAVNFCKGWSA